MTKPGFRSQSNPDECCHKTRLRNDNGSAPCPIGWDCPYVRKKALTYIITYSPGSHEESTVRISRMQQIPLRRIIQELEAIIDPMDLGVEATVLRRAKLELNKLDCLINGEGDLE